jgi:tetratricopeptide (TPR) repeat protein
MSCKIANTIGMREDTDLLQQAIIAARAGREWTARDMFLRVVEVDPKNELAWMWLTGLLDSLDDRIHACKQILKINPRNVNAEKYLAQLLAEKQKSLDAETVRVEEQLRGIRDAVKAGKKDSALADLRVLALNPQLEHPDLWRLLADLSPEMDERVRALEKFVNLAPNDSRAREELESARHFQQNPIHQAELYEEHGEIDKAILAYRMIAAKLHSGAEWNRIYWKIIDLENLKHEHVAHVSPALNIARLTAGPPVVYFIYVLLQVGVNPFASPDPVLWSGLVWVAAGSFMVALASVRSHNRLWTVVFKDVGARGTPTARLSMSIAGWILIALPFVILFFSAWHRFLDYMDDIILTSG